MNEKLSDGQALKDACDVTNVVVSALLAVYDSHADLDEIDLLQAIEVNTGFSPSKTLAIIDYMFNKDVNPYLARNTINGQKIALATSGLWLLEDSFMQGDDSINGMQIAEDQVVRAGFLEIKD